MAKGRKHKGQSLVPQSLPEEVLERVASAPRVDKNGKQRTLSQRDWAFVQEYVTRDGVMTRTEAAVRAGYTENTAKIVIARLLDPVRSPHVVAAINELRSELADKYGTTFERHMRDMQIIRDKAIEAGAWSAAVQAEYRRGQALGTIYVDRKEIRVGTIDSMSKEEVMRKLEELKRLNSNPPPRPVIDVNMQQVETVEVRDVVEEPEEPEEPAPLFNPGDILAEMEPPPPLPPEEMYDVEETGSAIAAATIGQSNELRDNED